MWISIITILFLIILILVYRDVKREQNNQKKETEIKDNNELPYKKKLLLTKNEWVFYKKLKPICDKYKLHIISKVRLADLVEVNKNKSDKDYIKYFNMISRKHIDFVICKPDNLQVLALIELDDKSHNKQERIDRDNFVNNVCKITNYKLLRITNYDDIEKQLTESEIIKHEENKAPC